MLAAIIITFCIVVIVFSHYMPHPKKEQPHGLSFVVDAQRGPEERLAEYERRLQAIRPRALRYWHENCFPTPGEHRLWCQTRDKMEREYTVMLAIGAIPEAVSAAWWQRQRHTIERTITRVGAGHAYKHRKHKHPALRSVK